MSARFNDREWKRGIQRLGKKFPAAARRALKRAGTTGRAQIARDIRADMGGLKVSTIKQAISMRVEGPKVSLEARGARIPLIQFGARGPEPSRGRGRGVSYNVGRGRSRNRSAFIATVGSHRGIFKRVRPSRLPITELFGPSIVKVFARLMPNVIPKMREALFKNMRHEFDRAVGKG